MPKEQSGARSRARWHGNRALGNHLLQAVQEPNSSNRAALETAALMLGSDKSRGYCLELICADFVTGANLDSAGPEVLLRAVARVFQFLPTEQKNEFLHHAIGNAAYLMFASLPVPTTSSAKRFCTAIVGDAKCAEASPISKFTINNFEAAEAMIWKGNLITLMYRMPCCLASVPR
jgi:hypothetical protein